MTCFKLTIKTLEQGAKIRTKLTIKTSERRQWRHSGVIIVHFEQVNAGWEVLTAKFCFHERVQKNWGALENLRL